MFVLCYVLFFFFKQKTAYEMRISDWSSDVCSSDLSSRHAMFSVSSSLPAHAGAASNIVSETKPHTLDQLTVISVLPPCSPRSTDLRLPLRRAQRMTCRLLDSRVRWAALAAQNAHSKG